MMSLQNDTALPLTPAVKLGRKVLVVDDNHASRIVAKAIFERENYVVSLAQNGTQGVAIAQTEPFDIILMDIQMPDISGITATQRIKSNGGVNSNTPVVALTAYSDKNIADEARSAGISEILTKPLRIGQLRSAWLRALESSSSPSFNAAPIHYESEYQASKSKLLDASIIAPLAQAASPEVLQKLYHRFYNSAEQFIADINTELSLPNADPTSSLDSIRRSAHALKGAASSVGFSQLSANAAVLQNATSSELGTQVTTLAPTLAVSKIALIDFLKSLKK